MTDTVAQERERRDQEDRQYSQVLSPNRLRTLKLKIEMLKASIDADKERIESALKFNYFGFVQFHAKQAEEKKEKLTDLEHILHIQEGV